MSATIPKDLLLAERIWRLYTGEEPENDDAGKLLEATRGIADHKLDRTREKNLALSAMREALDGANQQYLVELEALQAQVRVLREAIKEMDTCSDDAEKHAVAVAALKETQQ